MANYISANRYLTAAEMETNARWLYTYMTGRGWSPQAVCGMLGNMQYESNINPGVWENLSSADTSRGFGLVQWTPSTKYTEWCSDRALDPATMEAAVARIEYEWVNGLQYYPTDSYPLSWHDFKTSTADPSYLAMCFLHNYERPADQNQPHRGTAATAWYNLLKGSEGSGGSGSTTIKNKRMSVVLLYEAIRRR